MWLPLALGLSKETLCQLIFGRARMHLTCAVGYWRLFSIPKPVEGRGSGVLLPLT